MSASRRHRVRARLEALRAEVYALAVAARDPRTPWRARAVVLATVALAASPVDPVPDFVPVLGYVDDLIFVPAGVWLARRHVPDPVLEDARERADRDLEAGRAGLVMGAVVVLAWLLLALAAWWLLLR